MVNMTVIHSCMYDDNTKGNLLEIQLWSLYHLFLCSIVGEERCFCSPDTESSLYKGWFLNNVLILSHFLRIKDKWEIFPNHPQFHFCFISVSGWQHVAWFCVWLCEGSLKEGWNTWQIWSLWDIVTIRWITRLWR